MVKLNSRLEKALRIVEPFNCKPDLKAAITSQNVDMRGLTMREFAAYLEELEAMGLIKVFINEDSSDFSVKLSSDAASYFHDSLIERAKAVGRYAFNLLVGASGGVVVLVAERFLSA